MTSPSNSDSPTTRKGRYALYIVGALFGVLGMALETVPAFAEVTPTRLAKACALFGAVVLAVGRFASDHFIQRCTGAVTRNAR